MRVLNVITSLHTGGAEKLVVDSLPYYQERAVNVDLLVLLDCDTIFREKLNDSFKGNIYFLSKKSVYNPLHIFRIISYFKKYDLMHLHLFPVLYWVVLAKILSFSRIPLVYTEHSTNNKRREKFFFKYIDRFIYRNLSTVICISEKTKINLQEHLKKNSLPMPIITNGIVLNDYFMSNNVRSGFSFLELNDFVLIQVSSFRYPKDQMTLIKAMTKLPSNVKLVLAGDGPLRVKCEELTFNYNLQDRVFFLGNRSDIPSLINASDVFILSSAYEGVPLSIIEGMACGKPVIGSNVVGIKEIVESNGLLFGYQNVDELIEKILLLKEDRNLYTLLSERSILKSKEYDLQLMIKGYCEVYSKVCE